MNIEDIEIDWHLGFVNKPRLVIHVPDGDMPFQDEYVYEKKGQLYFAEKDGYVSFFAYHGPGEGYGGRVFSLKMKGGSIEELKGPWSSRCSVMNGYGFPPSVEATIVEGGNKYGGAVLVTDEFKELLEKNDMGLFEWRIGEEWGYEVGVYHEGQLHSKSDLQNKNLLEEYTS